MRSILLFSCSLLILGALFISSCGTAPPAGTNLTPTAEPDDGDVDPALEPAVTAPALPTAEPLPAEYPPPQPTLPTQPTYPPDYPGPPTPPPTVDPYPGGMTWIIRPVGIQCEDGTSLGYGDLRESVATLTAAGIRVVESGMTELMVAASCGSPTSAHFRVQIDAEDLENALSMGWEKESS